MILPATAQCPSKLDYYWPLRSAQGSGTVAHGYAADAARAVAGSVNDNADPIMPSEDFAYMLEERPGAYISIGNGDSAMCHHPAFDFNDDTIPAGCSWFAELVERRMPAL